MLRRRPYVGARNPRRVERESMVIEFKSGKATLRPRGAEVDISPSATVALMRDGKQIVALLGPDLQCGIGGFGATPSEALRDLAAQMGFEKWRLPGIDF